MNPSNHNDNPYRFSWRREVPLGACENRIERWFGDLNGKSVMFQMKSRFGKRINIGALKARFPFEEELRGIEAKRAYFDRLNDFVPFKYCPVCGAPRAEARSSVAIWRAVFVECLSCSHVYADIRPSDSARNTYYSNSKVGTALYTDPTEIDLRINQIYAPKLEWAMEAYQDIYGRPPKSVLDLGAGSGHFLMACKQRNLAVAGLEIDEAYVAFCKDQFNIELNSNVESLLANESVKFDLVTSFNVIEHLPMPADFLRHHARFASEESLSIIETPRYDSFTSCLQHIFNNRIRTHLYPYEHIQCFSDASFATLLTSEGFLPTHRWIFGQDVRELFFQLSVETKCDFSEFMQSYYADLQEAFDKWEFSDLLMVAARPGTNV